MHQSLKQVTQVKEEIQVFRKGNLSIVGYIFKIKLLTNELYVARCALSEEEKLMTVLGGLDELYE